MAGGEEATRKEDNGPPLYIGAQIDDVDDSLSMHVTPYLRKQQRSMLDDLPVFADTVA